MNKETIPTFIYDTYSDLINDIEENGYEYISDSISEALDYTQHHLIIKRKSDGLYFKGIISEYRFNGHSTFENNQMVQVFPKQITTTIYE